MSILALLFIGWALYHTTYELFTEVVYVETQLIPIIKKQALVSDEFWKFETFMRDLRQKRVKRFEWQYSFPVACTLGGVGILWLLGRNLADGHWRNADFVWLATCTYLLAILTTKMRHTLHLQNLYFAGSEKKIEHVRKMKRTLLARLRSRVGTARGTSRFRHN